MSCAHTELLKRIPCSRHQPTHLPLSPKASKPALPCRKACRREALEEAGISVRVTGRLPDACRLQHVTCPLDSSSETGLTRPLKQQHARRSLQSPPNSKSLNSTAESPNPETGKWPGLLRLMVDSHHTLRAVFLAEPEDLGRAVGWLEAASCAPPG